MGEALRSARGRAQGYTLHFTCMANVGSLALRCRSEALCSLSDVI